MAALHWLSGMLFYLTHTYTLFYEDALNTQHRTTPIHPSPDLFAINLLIFCLLLLECELMSPETLCPLQSLLCHW